MSRVSAALLVLAGTWLAAVSARAQDPAAEARALFEQGLSAYDEGNLPRAEELFRSSLALRRSGSVVFNLAMVLEQVGQLTEARALFGEVLADPDTPQEVTSQARAHVRAVEPRLARLTVEAEPGQEARVDGARVEANRVLSLDPGPHHVTLRAGGRILLDERVRLGEGERRRLGAVATPEQAASTVLQPGEAPRSDSDAGGDDTWVWPVVIGVAAAILVAGAIALGVGLSSQPSCDGNVAPGCITAGLASP